MTLQCRIVLNENNEIDYVETEDGQRSQLFDGLVETLGGDKNSALGFYALTESEDFKTTQKAKKTESPVYSIAKVYKDRLTKEKQNNPSQYWSVEIPSDEVIEDAARNGRIVDVNGGMGIVTEDGNMIGMFKYDKNAKNTTQAVQEARIQKGGVKLDNYDGYLTKLYQKNGFRVVARLPFNKEFAPEDWSEEMHGTPDVVFMVYDPQNKLKIEEKIFEDYDEASNYRDSFVEEAKALRNIRQDTDKTYLTKPLSLVEPSAEEVVQYANATEEELTPEQTIDLQDVIMSLGVNNSKEAEKKLKEALETKGFIRFNKKQMLNSGAFNKYEVKQILNSKEKQDQVEQSYRALKNSPTIEVEYPKDEVNRESKINSFGKQSVINPILPTETEGVETKTVTKEGVLENKTTGTDTEVILNNTYIGEENVKLSENLFFITKTFSPVVWENKKDAIFKVVKQIKDYAKDSGIDLKNIEEKVYTKSREGIINFFESLEDFLQKGDATEFAPLYNEMFELNKPVKESIRTDNKFDVYMDEDVSEYEAFTKHNLVKKSPTVYRKIKGDLSLDEAYSIISQNENISEEQLRKEVKENPLEVSDYEVDVEELEKMQLYKRYFNFPRNIPAIKTANQKKSFIRKANKWLLKSGNPYYKITKNGLELVSQDEITRSRAELTLPEYLKQEEKEEVIVEDLNKERRLEALVNPSSVQKVKGEFLYLEPEVVAIKNEVESMIRTPRGVFEYMYGQGNVGFYGKVTSEERPLSDMNYKQYTYLENSPELFQKAKNYYSKVELDEINKDNFECS